MNFYLFLLGALVVWRLTHLLVAEDGPWNLVVRLRQRAGEGFWGELLDCFYCLSMWVAAPLAAWIAQDWKQALLLWPALSGAGILLERVTGPRQPALSHVPYFEPIYEENHDEESEDHHELLRRYEKKNGVPTGLAQNPQDEDLEETHVG